MKIALITDTHFGARNDSGVINDYMMKFYDDIFFPYIIDNDIKTVIHLGDLVDRRKYVNFVTLNRLRTDFIFRLQDSGVDTHIIIGNHDTYYRNTNKINAVNELFGDAPFIHIYDRPETVNFDGLDVCFMPWINPDNLEDSMMEITNTPAQILMGHLEVSGFSMFKGAVCNHGISKKTFQKFDVVYSGHFHYKSDDGHIYYLGSPYEIMWSDYDIKKGFHTLDTETRELNFIENPYKLFNMVYYDDTGVDNYNELMTDFQSYEGTYVKVVVRNKQNPFFFDKFIDGLYMSSPQNISILEGSNELVEDDDIVDEAEDTLTILEKYVDSMSLDVDKGRLNNLLKDLYIEALDIV